MKRYKGIVCGAVLAVLLAGGCSPAPSPDTATGDPSTSVTRAAGSSLTVQTESKVPSAWTKLPVSTSAVLTISSTAGPRSSARRSQSTAGSSTASARPSLSAVSTTTRAKTTAAPRDGKITVTFSVDCSTAVAAGNEIAQAVSSGGMILQPTSMVLEEEATPFDALQKSGLVVASGHDAMGTYVKSIQSLAQKACGPGSGWLYSVNGSYPGKSCGKYKLKDGDVVRWRYTCSNGADG